MDTTQGQQLDCNTVTERMREYNRAHDFSHDLAIEVLSRLPQSGSIDLSNMAHAENVRIEIPELKMVLIRIQPSERDNSASQCQVCHWGEQVCMAWRPCPGGGDVTYEMPCDTSDRGRLPFKAYDMVTQEHQKPAKGRKEYIPDTPESFDIAGTWKSARTMIGMG